MERLKVKILCGKWCKVCACNVSLGERVFICCPYKLDNYIFGRLYCMIL